MQNQENTNSTTFCSSGQDTTLFLCHFDTDEGHLERSLVVSEGIDHKEGSYGVCEYIPREWFDGHLDKASHVEASVSINRPYVNVKMCGAHIIYKQNVAKFVRDLFPSDHVQNYVSHCQQIIDDVTKTTSVKELESIIRERREIDMIESVEQEQKGTLREPSDKAEQYFTSSNRFLLPLEAHDSGKTSSIAKQGCKSYSTMKLRSELQALLSRLFQVNHSLPVFVVSCSLEY